MKKFDLKSIDVVNLNTKKMKDLSGGNPLYFIAGAIAGGIIYDLYKAGSKALLKWASENSDQVEYYRTLHQ